MIKQRHIAALLAEFIGTFVLVLVVLNVSRYGLPFFTAIAAALSIAGFTSVFAKVSGANFNPAISLGLFCIRKLSIIRTIAYIAVQFLAGLAAWKLFEALTQNTLKNTTTSFDWRIFAGEAIGALIFGIVFAGVVKEKLSGYQAAATVGIGLFLGSTVAGLASLGVINPAVAVGSKMLDVNYALGPIVGSIVGMIVLAYVIHPIVRTMKATTPKVDTFLDEDVSTIDDEVVADDEDSYDDTPVKKATKNSSTKALSLIHI